MKDNNNKFYSNDDNDEISFISYLNFFLREKNFIIPITLIFTFITVLISYTIKPTWKGRFHIYVNDKKESSQLARFNSPSLNSLFRGRGSEKQTQEFILKSPSVLMPIFDEVKEYKTSKGENTKNFIYETWLKNSLDIYFEEGTNILTIAYKDKEKDFILNVLDSISNKYKNYSKRDKEKEISKTIIYLESQRDIFKNKSTDSLEKLNKFSIKNGLGDFDGFIQAESSFNDSIALKNLGITKEFANNTSFNQKVFREQNSGAGKRYRRQFAELERLEAEYLILSSKLKPNSLTLKNIESSILNLKRSLKRPNEILLEYRDLKNIAKRDETTLIEIENNLQSVKLEKAKQQDPWEMISKPTIDPGKVAPQRKRITILTFLFSFVLSSFIAFIKEKRSDIIYSLDDLKSSLISTYIETFYLNNKFLNNRILKQLLKKEDEKLTGFIYLNNSNLSSEIEEINKFIDIKEQSLVSLSDEEKMKNFNKLIILVELGKLTFRELKYLNTYIKLDNNKFLGWVYLDRKFKL